MARTPRTWHMTLLLVAGVGVDTQDLDTLAARLARSARSLGSVRCDGGCAMPSGAW